MRRARFPGPASRAVARASARRSAPLVACALGVAVVAGCHRERPGALKPLALRVVDGVLELPSPVVFEAGSDRLSAVSNAVLEIVLAYLKENPAVTVLRVEGHSDAGGSPLANQALSEKRALAVARWFTDAGVDCHRVLPVGFGATTPLVANDTPTHRSQNRRVAFVNAAVNGAPVGGAALDGGGRVAGDPCR